MKQVRYASIVANQLVESISQLVERNYFSNEDYAMAYVTDIAMFFQLNLSTLVAFEAPKYFHRYGQDLRYAMYRKNAHTTWYAFFTENETQFHVMYLANNHLIGQHLNINL